MLVEGGAEGKGIPAEGTVRHSRSGSTDATETVSTLERAVTRSLHAYGAVLVALDLSHTLTQLYHFALERVSTAVGAATAHSARP